MIVETSTYRFEAADLFTGQMIQFEGGSIWDAVADRSVQAPIFNFALSEIVDLVEEYGGNGKGENYDQAVRRYFDIKRPGVLRYEDTETEVAGLRALVRSANSNAKTPQGTGERWHLFVNIRLNDVFMQEFSADCALSVRNIYEPLFWQAIHSVSWHGEHREAIDRQEAARAEQYARIDDLTKRTKNVGRAAAADVKDSPTPEPPSIPAFEPTSDGKPLLKLNGLPFEIDNDETAWSISPLGRDLTIKLSGALVNAAQVEQTNLVDDAEWPVVIWLCLRDVYRSGGVPATKLRFEKGRAPRATLRLEGVGYGVEFAGEATVQGGWVSLQGHLGRSYEDGPGEPLDARVQLDPSSLDWSRYAFGTRAELDAAPADAIRFVRLDGEEFATIPAAVLAATHLEELTVWRGGFGAGRTEAESTPQLEIPAELNRLTSLRELRLSNYRINAMPHLGALRALTRVTIENAHLEHVPEGLLSLPQLRSLGLSGNNLTSLPAACIECPELQRITLVDNRLRELPPELFAQPKLKALDLRENPWQSLPEECSNERFEVDLELDDKRRLLDFTYKGAGGRGLVQWDESAYAAEGLPSLRDRLDAVCASPRLHAHREAVRLLARRSIAFQHADPEDYAQLGNHRFGGLPDLPTHHPYPRFGKNEAEGKNGYAYEFLAQINLDDLAPLQDYLPRRGMLYFFLTTIHHIYDGNRAAGKVIHYVPQSIETPVSESLVSGRNCQLKVDDYFEMMKPCYDGFRASAHVAISFPSMYSADQNQHLFRGAARSLRDDKSFLDDNADELLTEPLRAQFPHQHEIAGYGFSQHEQPELRTALSQRGNPEDWVILLKVTSSGDFQWGDAGELFFVIHKSDLAKSDFSNVFCTMESS